MADEESPARRYRETESAPVPPAAGQSERRTSPEAAPPGDAADSQFAISEPNIPAVPPTGVVTETAPPTLSPPSPAVPDPAVPDPSASTPPVAVTLALPTVAVPQPPALVSALPARAIAAEDELAGGSSTPLPSPLAWTMLAAARSEVGRRNGAVARPAATVSTLTTDVPATGPVGQAVSPLGTPEQTAAEAMAMQTAHSLPVLAMKAVLGLAWRIIADIEYAEVGGPDQENLAMLGAAVDEEEAFESVLFALLAILPAVLTAAPATPLARISETEDDDIDNEDDGICDISGF
jgi:hypothetical protein